MVKIWSPFTGGGRADQEHERARRGCQTSRDPLTASSKAFSGGLLGSTSFRHILAPTRVSSNESLHKGHIAQVYPNIIIIDKVVEHHFGGIFMPPLLPFQSNGDESIVPYMGPLAMAQVVA